MTLPPTGAGCVGLVRGTGGTAWALACANGVPDCGCSLYGVHARGVCGASHAELTSYRSLGRNLPREADDRGALWGRLSALGHTVNPQVPTHGSQIIPGADSPSDNRGPRRRHNSRAFRSGFCSTDEAKRPQVGTAHTPKRGRPSRSPRRRSADQCQPGIAPTTTAMPGKADTWA